MLKMVYSIVKIAATKVVKTNISIMSYRTIHKKSGTIAEKTSLEISKELLSLSECSAIDSLNYDNSIKYIALSTLKKELYPHIDAPITSRFGL